MNDRFSNRRCTNAAGCSDLRSETNVNLHLDKVPVMDPFIQGINVFL